MGELLNLLFAAASQFSGLPAVEAPPPSQAMPYAEMLREVCAGLKSEPSVAASRYSWCAQGNALQPAHCGEPPSEGRQYEQCMGQSGLVAAYLVRQRRIVYRDDLDLNNDSDNSFLVHEYVHALQRLHFGDRCFASCAGVLESEKQAYAAQQKYLESRGQLLKVGDRLRFFRCE